MSRMLFLKFLLHQYIQPVLCVLYVPLKYLREEEWYMLKLRSLVYIGMKNAERMPTYHWLIHCNIDTSEITHHPLPWLLYRYIFVVYIVLLTVLLVIFLFSFKCSLRFMIFVNFLDVIFTTLILNMMY